MKYVKHVLSQKFNSLEEARIQWCTDGGKSDTARVEEHSVNNAIAKRNVR